MTETGILILTLLCLLKVVSPSILLWGTQNIEIPAFKNFDDQDYAQLLDQLQQPRVVVFSSKYLSSAMDLNKFLTNYTSSYVPNGKLTLEAQDLTGDQEQDFKTIKNKLQNGRTVKNELVILKIHQEEKSRSKRKSETSSASSTSVTEGSPSTETNVVSEPPETPKGPILYSAASPSDKMTQAMIFSTKPPLLKTSTNSSSSNIYLGEATVANMDVRDTYTRLIATIPVDSGKIILRFKFLWRFEYWYLSSVEVEFVGLQAKQYNLTLDQEVTAPRTFSYHCGGEVIFRDQENNIELNIFDIQAQPDARNGRFGDDYNCVPFTTAPIWSGLFVTFILSIGLGVGLTALGSIKTMDKFDNQKTRALTITVWE